VIIIGKPLGILMGNLNRKGYTPTPFCHTRREHGVGIDGPYPRHIGSVVTKIKPGPNPDFQHLTGH
jgi:hypothetical protein